MTRVKSSAPLRFAIIGAGLAADFHHRALEATAEAQLAAVAHYAPARFEAISEHFGVPCAPFDEVLARPDVDAVIVATPSGQHAEQVVRAAEAGKHVLVEKPMALHLEDADRMIETCRRAGVRLGVVFQRRAQPLFQRVHRAVQAGDLGRLTLGTVVLPYVREDDYYAQAAWRGTWAQDGGGALMNQGIHLVDLLLWYVGVPEHVSAYARTLARDVEVEDTAAATLQFESGALATIAATTTARPGFAHRLSLYGTAGGIEIEGERVRRWTLAAPEQAQVEPFSASAPDDEDAGAGGAPGGIETEGHARLLRDFVEAVRQDRPPLVSGSEGRRSLAAVRSIYEAAGASLREGTAGRS